MSDQELSLAILLGAAVAVTLLVVGHRILWAWRFPVCEHTDLTRFWFRQHHFVVRCKRCFRVWKGRDTRHTYPDEARPERKRRRA